MKKPQKKHGGGRPKGPPSKRMSLYLEKEYVAAIKKNAGERGTTISDIVRKSLTPIVFEDDQYVRLSSVVDYLKNGPLADKYFISREKYEQLDMMAGMGLHMLHVLRMYAEPFYRGDGQWAEYYADREREVALIVQLFWGWDDPDEALRITRQQVDAWLESARARGEQLYRESQEAEAARAEPERGEKPKPRHRRGLGLRNLFRQRTS